MSDNLVNIITCFVQAATIIIACITIVNSNQDSKRQNNIKVEVKIRINVLKQLKKSFASFISLLNPILIKSERGSNNYLKELYSTATVLRLAYKKCFPHDLFLIENLEKAVSAAESFWLGNKNITDQDIILVHENMTEVADICIGAYWKFIKSQSNGDKKLEEDYITIFNNYREMYYKNRKKTGNKQKD